MTFIGKISNPQVFKGTGIVDKSVFNSSKISIANVLRTVYELLESCQENLDKE